MICCIYQIAGDKPPTLFSQSGVAVSALQLFRAHISTYPSIPAQAEVLEMQPWRQKLQWGRPNFTLNGAKLSSSFHRLISFSWNTNLVVVLCKVFPLKAPAALFSPLQLLVAILEQGREDQLLCCHQQDYGDSEGENAGEHQPLWEVWPCASQAHTPVLLHLFFPVEGSVIPPISVLGWGQVRKISKWQIIFKKKIIFIKYREFGGEKEVSCIDSAAGKSPGMYFPSL